MKKADPGDMNTKIRRALWRRHERRPGQMRQWAYFEEMTLGIPTGKKSSLESGIVKEWNERRIDGFAINLYKSNLRLMVSYEIKVTRSDFRTEMADPTKREPAMALTNQFFFATPKAMLDPKEIPKECGLMEYEKGRMNIKKKAPKTECPEVSPGLVMRMIWRVEEERAEARKDPIYDPMCPNCGSQDISWNGTRYGRCYDCRGRMVISQDWVKRKKEEETMEIFNKERAG